MRRNIRKEEELPTYKSAYKPNLTDSQMSKLPMKQNFQHKVAYIPVLFSFTFYFHAWHNLGIWQELKLLPPQKYKEENI